MYNSLFHYEYTCIKKRQKEIRGGFWKSFGRSLPFFLAVEVLIVVFRSGNLLIDIGLALLILAGYTLMICESGFYAYLDYDRSNREAHAAFSRVYYVYEHPEAYKDFYFNVELAD